MLDGFADIYGSGRILKFSDTADTFLTWHAQSGDGTITRFNMGCFNRRCIVTGDMRTASSMQCWLVTAARAG